MTRGAFFRAELGPAPGRARAAARLTVAAGVAAFLVFSFHIPHGVWIVFTIFILSQANAGASLEKGLQRTTGTVIGSIAALVAIPLIAAAPWFELPLVSLGAGLALFLSRTATPTYPPFLAGLTFMILLSQLGPQERIGTEALWRIGTVMFGIILGTAAQLILWPDDPEKLLLEDLAGELARVRKILVATAGSAPASKPRLDPLVAGRLGRRLDLVANTEVRHPSLQHRHADRIALVIQIERLSSAVLWLERVAGGEQPPVVRAMFNAISAECGRVEHALASHRAPETPWVDFPGRGEALAAAGPTMLPVLIDVEGALRGVRDHLSFLEPDADRKTSPLDAPGRRPFFGPACSISNTPALVFALKGSLAVAICYLLVKGCNWPGIWTCAITCVIVAQSTVGASVRKAWLRICGATFGGLLALALALTVAPLSNDLALFLAALTVCFGISGWIAVGGPRVSYIGIQMAYALAMCFTTVFGPLSDLVVGRDRVIGILIGIGVAAAVNLTISPSSAVSQMRNHLAATLRHMADMCRVGLSGPGVRAVNPKGLREKVYQDLAAVGRLDEEAESEPWGHDPNVLAERRALLAAAADAHETIPGLFTVVHHWLDIDLREAVSDTGIAELTGFATIAAGSLEAMADRVAKGVPGERPDLRVELALAETALRHMVLLDGAAFDGRTACDHVEARLELWRRLLPAMEKLAADVDALPSPRARPGTLETAPSWKQA